MKQIITLLLLIISVIGFSQNEFYYKDYDWKSTPETFDFTKEELEKDQVTVSEKKYIHFFHRENQFLKCVLEHKIIRLNNDKAVELNNKYYVSNYGSLEVIKQKARVITPKGKIIELSSKDIKTANDENGNPQYQYFAFEGIEVGSIIEYFHVILFNPRLSGDLNVVQNNNFKRNVEHEIIVPPHLEFKIKSLNNLPDFTSDTTEKNYNKYVLKVNNIEGIDDEIQSAYDALVMKYYFMLHKNNGNSTSNFYNYQNVTKDIHSRIFTALNKKDKKGINQFIKESKALEATSTLEKVRAIENHFKESISVTEDYFENSENIESILKNKVTTDVGEVIVLVNCFRELNIPVEVVYTTNRFESKFINDFEGYNFLNDILIYINELDSYISPNLITRVGYPPFNLLNTKGLFIKEIKVGELISSIGKVKEIKSTKMEQSVDEINTIAKLNDDLQTIKIDIERKETGYKAYEQSVISYVNETAKKEILESFINYIDSDSKPENIVFENDNSNLYGYKPFIGKGTISSTNFTEQAGNKILFKIGMLIGPQTNLYNKENRKLPVETEFNRQYIRTIKFEIPEGYYIKNPEVINFNVTPTFNNNSLGFVSNYVIKDNLLIVNVREWYNSINIPLENYKDYEDVINAAADFNKVKIILERK